MTGSGMVPILAAPHLDPGTGRIEMEAPAGLTLADHVAMALPGASEEDLRQARVALVTARGVEIVERKHWHRVRPRPGVRVVIRILAGKNALRAVLSIVITVAAIAIGQAWGMQFGQMLGLSGKAATAIGTAALTTGVTVIGNLLLNALIPPVKPESRDTRNTYSVSGWQNRMDPDGAVPVVLGRMRYAPAFAALPHSEIVGDDQYMRAVFTFGEGPVAISDLRIGETAITEFTDVQVEIREGRASDAPQTIIPRQIAEESVGVELTRPLPRDALGEVIDGQPAIETPVVRTTGADARGASVIIAFPAGMIRFDDKGRSHQEGVRIRIEQRPVDGEDWQTVTTLQIRARKMEGFYRQHTWNFPARGRWQVRLTMLTDETTDSKIQRRSNWAALQTLRPEYPLNYGRPLALVAVRVKATHQLSGALDNLNAIAERYCLDWDQATGTWVERWTSNPASLYRHVLQSPANPGAVGNAGIDLEQLEDWHDFCRLHDLKYDRVLDQAGTTMREVLTEIAAAGRATPRHDGMRWGVVIDRPGGLVIDHIGPRNSWSFSSRRVYAEPPHAFRVAFQDATNDWKPAERLVRWPGYVGEITKTEALTLPGKTDPAEVWREARRRQYEAIHRPDTYQVTQDGPARVATRGDLVTLSQPVLDVVQVVGRVKAVVGNLVELDEAVTMAAGEEYGVRFRVFADDQDTIGVSVVRNVVTEPGETSMLAFDGPGQMPLPGDLIYFGKAGEETFPLVVTGVEPAEDLASIVHGVDAAPIIDELLAQDDIPAWSGRVGAEIEESQLAPSEPRITSITSGAAGTGQVNRIEYLIAPGSGPVSVARFLVEHRLLGASDWTTVDLPAANGGGRIEGYSNGDLVDIRAQAVSTAEVAGPHTATVTITVGAGDAGIPAALDPDAVMTTTVPGGVLIQLATGDDANTSQIQLYRSRNAVLDRETDASGAPVEVAPKQTYALSVGDMTRSSLIVPAAWTAGAGWTVTGSDATHAPGAAGELAQPLAMQAGRWYRFGFTVSDHAGGAVTPRLSGGTPQPGTAASADGHFNGRLQATAGNDSFEFAADSAFEGTISNILVYLETAACLDAGTHYLWVEPLNDDGVPGPIHGPIAIEIV
ncbi:phage tail protein [Paracoccus denitrificans]|uniref:TipJ family phage tail tip protein n=1 Tax=Paracoccus denitrificans TaxID=266 RepID=UPI001E2E974D|nr:phage tail protein [Paracoccus denitrificans]UFS63849.1 phage tail protein [Paracoccus denitrificans]